MKKPLEKARDGTVASETLNPLPPETPIGLVQNYLLANGVTIQRISEIDQKYPDIFKAAVMKKLKILGPDGNYRDVPAEIPFDIDAKTIREAFEKYDRTMLAAVAAAEAQAEENNRKNLITIPSGSARERALRGAANRALLEV